MRPVIALVQQSVRIARRQSIKPTIRHLSNTSICQVAQAPSTRTPILRRRPSTKVPVALEAALDENIKPTLAQLKDAKKAGALDLEPEAVIRVIRSFCHAVGHPGFEVRLCKEHNITPRTLAMVAMILTKNPARELRQVGHNMLYAAANLGDLNAIVMALQRALRTAEIDHPRYLVSLTKLQYYANQGNVEAMVLYGKILESKKRDAEALEMFRKAAEAPRDPSTDADVAEALVKQGLMCLRHGRKEEGQSYFQKAALELDNPFAYFQLALLMPESSPVRQTYLLKAAASGVVEADFEIAKHFLVEVSNPNAALEQRKESQKLGEQWLQVAAYQGHEKSQEMLDGLVKL